MNMSLLARSILSRLWRYKAKTVAMGLGIMIAVFSTVVLLAVIDSVKARFLAANEKAYPPNAVVVMGGGGPMSGQTAGRDSLKPADIETIVSTINPTVTDLVLFGGARDVKRGGNSVRVGITGFSENEESVRGRSVEDGEFFTAEDVRDRAHVALLGSSTAETLFPGESPIGAQIFIDNVPFQVKGILETVGVGLHGDNMDSALWIPYTTLMDTILRVNYVSGATFLLEDGSRTQAATEEITRILRERHQIAGGQKDDFAVINSVVMQQIFERSFRTFNIFIPLIAATAFLISALVILSIMQISIKGRVQEIGLRKALGARSRDLQTQIVLEVLIVSIIASLAGIVLAQAGIMAVAAPLLRGKLGIQQQNPSALVTLVAVGAALATGLLGGVLPARRAAKLKPVEALK